MKFLCLYKPAATEGTPPTEQEMNAMAKLIEEMTNEGTLLATEGCLPSAMGARVRRAKGKVTVTDGPFTEAKELVAGFALIEAKSKAHAIELTKRFLEVAGDGESEIRQIYDAEQCGEEFSPELAERHKRSAEKMAKNASR